MAGYAAIVATGALALEIRRWFETGARLSISVMPQMQTFNIPGTEGNNYLVVNVSNRGQTPTTITHFALFHYGSWINWLRRKRGWAVVVLRPQPPGSDPVIPSVLRPGESWSGMALHEDDLVSRMKSGYLYVAIHATHSDKPTLARVRLRKDPELPDKEEANTPPDA